MLSAGREPAEADALPAAETLPSADELATADAVLPPAADEVAAGDAAGCAALPAGGRDGSVGAAGREVAAAGDSPDTAIG